MIFSPWRILLWGSVIDLGSYYVRAPPSGSPTRLYWHFPLLNFTVINRQLVGLFAIHGNHVIFLWSKLGKGQKHSSHLILWEPVGVKLTLLCWCPVLVFDVFFSMQNICSFFVFVWFYLYFLISEAFLDLYNLNMPITPNAPSLLFKNLLEVFLIYLLFLLFCLNLWNIWTQNETVSASYLIRIYWITVPVPPPHVMWYSPHTNW